MMAVAVLPVPFTARAQTGDVRPEVVMGAVRDALEPVEARSYGHVFEHDRAIAAAIHDIIHDLIGHLGAEHATEIAVIALDAGGDACPAQSAIAFGLGQASVEYYSQAPAVADAIRLGVEARQSLCVRNGFNMAVTVRNAVQLALPEEDLPPPCISLSCS